jgi:hypothetical protein
LIFIDIIGLRDEALVVEFSNAQRPHVWRSQSYVRFRGKMSERSQRAQSGRLKLWDTVWSRDGAALVKDTMIGGTRDAKEDEASPYRALG